MLTLGPEICNSESCARPGCSPEAGCQGHAIREIAPEIVREQAERLKADANRWGVAFSFTVGEHPAPAAPSDGKAQRVLLEVLDAVQKYLPPDGVPAKETLSRIIGLVDPWPLASLESGLVGVTMEAEDAIPEGWALSTADFSVRASEDPAFKDANGWVSLTRRGRNRAAWFELGEAGREASPLYVSGHGPTLRAAILDAAAAARQSKGEPT